MTAAPTMLTVYDGQTCIGFVLTRGPGEFESFTADERGVGIFPTQREAAAALSREHSHG